MALSGNLQDFDISNIFQMISQENKTGKLIVKNSTEEGIVVFKSGMIVYAGITTQNITTFLSNYLLYVKKYSKSEVAELRAVFHDNIGLFTSELVAKQYVTSEELLDIVEPAVTDLAGKIFGWKEGTYNFVTLSNVSKFQIGSFMISTNAVGMEAARQNDEFARMKELMHPEMVFTSSGRNPNVVFDTVNLENLPAYIAATLDGTLSIESFCKRSFFSEYQIYEALKELLEDNIIAPLSHKISSSVNAALKRTDDEVDNKLSRSILSTFVTGAVAMVIFLFGTVFYRGIISLPTNRISKETANIIEKEQSFEKISVAKLYYRIENMEAPSDFSDLKKDGLLSKRDLTPIVE